MKFGMTPDPKSGAKSEIQSGKTVLVVGSGAREHALAWKLSQSPQVIRVIVSPGNAGMPWEKWPISLHDGKSAFNLLAQKAKSAQVDLAVIGPDNPLADGIVDIFTEAGVLTFGPTAKASRIESSKAFSKEVMSAAGVPTAQFWAVKTPEEARAALLRLQGGWVVKADGLAFGKGVHVCSTLEEAFEAVETLFKVSPLLIIEERVPHSGKGEEISWMAFCDGNESALLEPARDYKRLLDHDQGPNTGGMGAFSPVPDLPKGLDEDVRELVFQPILRELKRRGAEFRGILYAGLMLDRETGRFWVLEFNARFGDPEAQVLLPRMDADLFAWCEAAALGELKKLPREVPFQKDSAVYVVVAAKGYPTCPERDQIIHLQKSFLLLEDERIFVAGVREKENQWLTQGGRILGVLGMGDTLESAREKAYSHLKEVHFEGMTYRTDIAERGIT